MRKLILLALLGCTVTLAILQHNTEKVEPHVFVIGAAGTGSGTIIAPNKVLTARHVVHLNFASAITVMTSDGRLCAVRDVLFLQKKDAAILVLEENLKTKKVKVTAAKPRRGDKAWFIGSPNHFTSGFLLREGYVASEHVNQDLRGAGPDPFADANNYDVIQIIAATTGGDSGSGVYDERGRLFGIVVTGNCIGWTGVLPVSEFIDLIE